ncbi:exo-inulinase [Aspergillus luchuensis]|uniref:Exo-inulinase n=1 Tax=Aspergillus kawachii TaxID=1069201 RepID=A0A146FEH1_ASPKA|nr:exo-inulinase [Aspergillus luchuensis]
MALKVKQAKRNPVVPEPGSPYSTSQCTFAADLLHNFDFE